MHGQFGIALGAWMLGLQSGQVLLHQTPSPAFLSFLFYGTLCSYNTHTFLTVKYTRSDTPAAPHPLHPSTHLILALGAGVAALPFIVAQLSQGVWFALILALPFFYSAPKLPQAPFRNLKRIAVVKTFYLAASWTLVTIILPVILNPGIREQAPWTYLINRFFLLYALCLIFDLRDRDADAREGIHSLPTRFPEKTIDRIFYLCIIVVVCSGIWVTPVHGDVKSLLVIQGPAWAMALLYPWAKKLRSAYFYHGVLDGLLWIPGMLALLLPI